MKESIRIGLVIMFLCVVLVLSFSQKRADKQAMKTLKAINGQEVASFKIYPRMSVPEGEAIEFQRPDLIVQEFFPAIQDFCSYKPSHDTISSQDDSWFLEMTAENINMHINFYIPSGQKNFVVGVIRRVNDTKTHSDFQSEALYRWYQKYSHRWLVPEGAQLAPASQPETPVNK
jgi:hypothetical protein